MRILLSGLGRDVYPTGVSRVAANHAIALVTDRVTDHVVLTIGSWQRDLYRMLLVHSEASIELAIVSIKNSSVSRNLWFAEELPRLAQHYGADIVHHSFPAPVIRRLFPCPVVVTMHDFYPYDMPENFGFPRYYANRLILRQCVGSVDGIACVSNSTMRRLHELFPNVTNKIPVEVTGNYIRISKVTPIAPGVLGGLKMKSFILAVAQHRKNKNLKLLIRGYAELLKSGKYQFPLVIVGAQGPETAALTQLTESLGIVEEVRFMYSVADEELSWLYTNCSLFVACSSIEGYCLPVAEALINHAKVVCSDIGILRDVGGEQCNYFSLEGNIIQNITAAIMASLEQPIGTNHPIDRFSEKNVLAAYVKLYSRVLH